MCLLAFVNKDAEPDYSGLEIACKNNPDGFGWAINTRERFLIGRFMHADAALETYKEQMALHPGFESIFHARIATHGTVNIDNVHPFWIGGGRTSLLAHNGILRIEMEKGEKRSDSKVFAEDYMSAKEVIRLDNPEAFAEMEKMTSGSKLVILTNKPRAKKSVYIINEEAGHWLDGTWWSNHSYEPRKVYSGYEASWHGGREWFPSEWKTESGEVVDWKTGQRKSDGALWIPGHHDQRTKKWSNGYFFEPPEGQTWPLGYFDKPKEPETITVLGPKADPKPEPTTEEEVEFPCPSCHVVCCSDDALNGYCSSCFSCLDCGDFIERCQCFAEWTLTDEAIKFIIRRAIECQNEDERVEATLAEAAREDREEATSRELVRRA